MRIRSLISVPLLTALLASSIAGCSRGCAAALLTGQLSEQSSELVVVPEGGGPAEHVRWPDGYRVRDDAGTLVVTDVLGRVRARDGDRVRLGGGEAQSGTWNVCGQFDVVAEPGS